MMNKGVAIRYGDVAPEAKENFVPTASKSEFDDLSQLQQYNLNFPSYANPCELYQTILDGTATAFPSVPENANLGLWSERISNDKGFFVDENGEKEPIVLTLTSEGQYSSQGFTFTFDTYNQIYPTHINIKWYRNGQLIVDDGKSMNIDFYPDNAFYFCRNHVSNYNKVVITFYSLNMPKNRLKLRVIDYGYGTFFYGNELRNVKLIQELDPISTQISINTADFTLDSKTDMEYSFQAKQPLSVYFNGKLKATTFVKSSKRKAKFLWQVQSEDYIGVMDSIPYYGGMYTDVKAVDVLEDIFTVAKVPYSIDDVFADLTVTGYIPYTTCREALMQVAFAIQAVVDTSDSDAVKLFALENDIKQTVPLNRIMQGQSFEDEETVTGVEVTVHIYEPKEATADNRVTAYNAKESGAGNNIFVKFDEPLHSLFTSNGGEILESSANYAIINAPLTSFRLFGYSYEHTTQTRKKNNPVVLASEIEKVVAVDNATLVSYGNIDNILDNCFDWLTRTNTTNLKIVEGKHVQYGDTIKWGQKKWGSFKWGGKHPNIVTYDPVVNIGENINAETEYLGIVSGRIIKQSFALNGGIIIKEAVLK